MKTALLLCSLPVVFAMSCSKASSTPAAVSSSNAAPMAAAAAPKAGAVAACTASQVKLILDGRNGDYAGMSHDGALVVLKNIGTTECTVPKRPVLTFTDAASKPLDLKPNVPAGMHPGPVMVPVKLMPGKWASGKMQWVTGEVYDKSTCVQTAHAAVQLPGGEVKADLAAHVCGQQGEPLTFEQEWLQPGTAPVTDAAH